MTNYISIDGGTTNTRIRLVSNEKITDSVKLDIGARSVIGDNSKLKQEIKNAIFNILKNNNLTTDDISVILASGMITSEFGLYELPHINTPAGISELNMGLNKILLKDISDIPFVFIPGVKIKGDNLESTDFMRGEETELMGIEDKKYGNAIYVLPGSHSKIICTDKDGRITYFSSMLTGEMISAIARNTILSDAVDLSNTDISEEYLIKGYKYCNEFGINEALFKVRILKNIYSESSENIYSFFLGAVLNGEIEKILKRPEETVVIGGKKQIKKATAYILNETSDKTVVVLSDEIVENSVVSGQIKIYEYK